MANPCGTIQAPRRPRSLFPFFQPPPCTNTITGTGSLAALGRYKSNFNEIPFGLAYSISFNTSTEAGSLGCGFLFVA